MNRIGAKGAGRIAPFGRGRMGFLFYPAAASAAILPPRGTHEVGLGDLVFPELPTKYILLYAMIYHYFEMSAVKNKVDIRLATKEDLEAIEALMKRSMRILGQGHYSEQQIAACCQYVCVPELQLIVDQTFFVAISDHTMVGCGGWSFRKTLYAGPSKSSQAAEVLDPEKDPARIRAMFIEPTQSGKGIGSLILSQSEKAAWERGFRKGVLGATLSGLAFYQSKGWSAVAHEPATLPDGTVIDVIRMEKVLNEG